MSENTDKQAPKPERQFIPISLRDHFAGLAMQGMITEVSEPNESYIADHAYDMADQMLRRRKIR